MGDPVAARAGRGALCRRRRDPGASCGMQALGRVAGGGSLNGVPLCLTQLSNVLHERGKACDQRDLREGTVAADRRGGGQQPGCAAQADPRWGRARDTPIGGTGSAVVGIGGLAQHPAPQRRRSGMQGVGGGPGGVRGRERVGSGEVADLSGSVGGSAGGVLPDRVAFGRGERLAGRSAGGFPAAAELRQGQVGREFPAAEPHVCQRRLGAAVLGDCRAAAISSARSRIWASRASGSVSRSMAWQTISMPLPRTKWCAGSSLPLA